MKKLLFYIIFFLLCLTGYLIYLSYSTDNFKPKHPTLSYIEPFTFIDQDGKKVTEKSMKNKVVIVNYFFTTCQGICPSMNTNIMKLHEKYLTDTHVLFISHTVQPEIDSVPILKKYAKLYAPKGKNWKFVTGNKLNLYHMARKVYKIDDPNNNVGDIKDQFLHTQFIALVNKKGEIKGIYDGLETQDLKLLEKDINTYLSY